MTINKSYFSIKTMLFVCLLYFANLGINETFAQVNFWETLQLSIVSSNDSIKDLKSLEKLAEKSLGKSSQSKIDTSLSYKFMLTHEKGWKENCPSPDCRYKIDNYFIGDNDTLYSGEQLIELLNLHSSRISSHSDTTTSMTTTQILPSVHQLLHPDVQNNSYLRINKGHYYPHGNQSSWMIDRFLYFEVVNENKD